MDLAAHAIAKGRVHHAVTRERQLAAKGFANDVGLKVHAVLAAYACVGARQSGFDQLAYAICVHGSISTRQVWVRRAGPGADAFRDVRYNSRLA
jgi:hypothetical protein